MPVIRGYERGGSGDIGRGRGVRTCMCETIQVGC